MTVIIDSTTYNIRVTSLARSADFLDRYADRTQDGVLHRQLIGVYFNYKLKFAQPDDTNISAYQALWLKLTEPVEFHTVTVPDVSGFDYTFTAYFANVADEIEITKVSANFWKNLTVNFIAQSPARVPA